MIIFDGSAAPMAMNEGTELLDQKFPQTYPKNNFKSIFIIEWKNMYSMGSNLQKNWCIQLDLHVALLCQKGFDLSFHLSVDKQRDKKEKSCLLVRASFTATNEMKQSGVGSTLPKMGPPNCSLDILQPMIRPGP